MKLLRYGSIFVFLGFVGVCSVEAQTPTLERLKEALALERKSDLSAAQDMYASLVNDPDWGIAARLSLARIQRWRSFHDAALANYEMVLASQQASAGMRDEATLGIAHIDALEFRLRAALSRLNGIDERSPIYNQVRDLRERVIATHPTRVGGNFGQVHNKDGPTDASWQLRLTHQLDMRNVVSVAYARNSLQQRANAPDSELNFVKGQTTVVWRYQVPLGVAYSVEGVVRDLNLGASETSLRLRGSAPINADWRASAGIQRTTAAVSSETSGFVGLSTSISKSWQAGGTVFAANTAQANAGVNYSWMLNTTWEDGPWMAQWFLSRSLDTASYSNTAVLRQRLKSGPTWRAELRHDRNGSTAVFGLDIPWGRWHGASASVQSSPTANQWALGVDYALPNGVQP